METDIFPIDIEDGPHRDMTLTEALQDYKSLTAWGVVEHIVKKHVTDPYLVASLMNMLTLRYRFDHFQYVSSIPSSHVFEEYFQKVPVVAEAICCVRKIKFALPHFPRAYVHIWNEVSTVLKSWEFELTTFPRENLVLALQIVARTP